MKKNSVKIRLSLGLAFLLGILAILLLLFLVSISNTVIRQVDMSRLSGVVQSNLGQINQSGDTLELGDYFRFRQNGIVTLVYSGNGTLLAGQIPVSFTGNVPFENGYTRTVDAGEERYLVMDLWCPFGWEDGVWVRGLLEETSNRQANRDLFRMAFVALPVFMLLAALGSYWIVRRAFQPLEKIIGTAETINDASDLSRRIGTPAREDEFSRLAEAFDELFERLERMFESEKQFAADASHELRTPIAVIRGACEYAQKYEESPEERRETIEMIDRQTKRMSELVSNLLNMTRLEQGMELADKRPVDLGKPITSLCAEQMYDPSRLHVEYSEDVTVVCNPILMTRLAQNLIENAFCYGKENGQVWVKICRKGEEILLSVRDDGIGIDSEQQERIWQRFYQVDKSRSGKAGAGLGLSMVRQIARAHGGYMTVESALGKGSEFTLHLKI